MPNRRSDKPEGLNRRNEMHKRGGILTIAHSLLEQVGMKYLGKAPNVIHTRAFCVIFVRRCLTSRDREGAVCPSFAGQIDRSLTVAARLRQVKNHAKRSRVGLNA